MQLTLSLHHVEDPGTVESSVVIAVEKVGLITNQLSTINSFELAIMLDS